MSERLYAWYADDRQLLSAIQALRNAGFTALEAYTPYPVTELPHALSLPRSPLARWALATGLSGAAATYAVQWLLNAHLYPINVGSRPPHFPLSYVPICFEVGVLCAALTVFIGLLRLGKLGRLYDPIFEVPDYALATREQLLLEVRVEKDGAIEDARDALMATGPVRLGARAEGSCA